MNISEISTRPVVFLFNESNEDAYKFVNYFVNCLKNSKNFEQLNSRILIGSLLLQNFCKIPSEVKFHPKSSSSQKKITFSFDKNYFISLLSDLEYTVNSNWSTLDEGDFFYNVGSYSIFCICMTDLSESSRIQLDELLQHRSGYLGAFEPDFGNPLHENLFLENLLKENFFISMGKIYFNNEYENYDKDEVFKSIDSKEFSKLAPPMIKTPKKLSDRGQVTAKLIKSRGKKNHFEQLAMELFIGDSSKYGKGFEFVVGKEIKNVLIPKEKLTEYALNITHPKGKDKAYLFKKLLAIEVENWRYLAEQIVEGIHKAKICDIKYSSHGIQYYLNMPIKGLNGRNVTIRTAWIVIDDSLPRLTTTYVLSEKEQLQEEASVPYLVVEKLEGEERWRNIYNLALSEGEKAAREEFPTPVLYFGEKTPNLEGIGGTVFIVISKKNIEFIKWLMKSEEGFYYKDSYVLFAKTVTRSRDRAIAYAEKVSKIFRINGIESSVVEEAKVIKLLYLANRFKRKISRIIFMLKRKYF